MKDFDSLRDAAARMLKTNMNLTKGERVAFVSDIPIPESRLASTPEKLEEIASRAAMTRRIFEMMREDFPENPVDFIEFPMTGRHGTEPPAEIAARFLEYDALILMTTFSLSHTNAREKACRVGARVASMPGIEAAMFAQGGPMAADYSQIAEESIRWADRLTSGRDVHVTTPFGTDLRFSIAGREGHADTGLIHKKGQTGNLPAGEAYIAPVEGTAAGRLVVPAGWHPGLNKEMTLIFEKGFVTGVEGGGNMGEHFVKTFAFEDETLKHRRNCAELGIGTNPNAKKPDNILEAEKICGTIHIAVGDSAHFGGANESDLHEDFVLIQPTLIIDSRKALG